MSSPPPTKPPRGVKQGKETSGLLMSVIRTLSASETNEQREKERAKLEKEYKKSDARLDELVAAHAQEIMDVMQKFSAVGAALSVWGQHCDAATARLAACRGLLRLRRDDLKRLWMTSRTHHYALQMLTDIERVVVSERSGREQLAAGRVLACAHTLRAALAAADTSLSHVDALRSTRLHLEAKKRALVEAIVRRVSEAVYRGERGPPLSQRRRTALLLAELTKSEEVTDAYLQDITPEFEASLTDEDKTFETTVMISLEALGVLEQLKEATEKFKVQIQNELLEVIDSVSRRIIEEGDVEPDVEGEEDEAIQDDDSMTETGRPLAKLVSILVDEFKAIAARNKRLLQLWRAALQKHKLSDSCLHNELHYWSAVQQVLQLLVAEYVDIASVCAGGAARGGAPPASPQDPLPLNDYFGKKRPQRRRHQLFKLTPSGGGGAGGVGGGARRHASPLVCAPDPAHLRAVLPALHALAAHIEHSAQGGECSLRAFLSDYVRSGETERLARAARDRADRALRAPAAWRERAQLDASDGSASAAVFRCVVSAWGAVRAAAAGARACGACGGAGAARAALGAAAALGAHCRAAHGRLVPPGARAHRWLADDDIVRFLQALPNWRRATTPLHNLSAQELKQAYSREAEILGNSLCDGGVGKNEIIADVNVLADIAVLANSMDWLATNVRSLPSIITAGGTVKLSDKFVNDINSAAMIFDEISHKCLLLLHLEMRIECFHYLGQEEGGAEGEGGGGGGAGRLARALLAFHEHAAHLLPPPMLNYIMEGIGEMMSAAVVWVWRGGVGGAGGGGGAVEVRLATLRHALAALHVPHDGLHRAHAYLHLLACTPQEIITSVREKGAQFSELDYLNAFKVIEAKRGIPASDMKQHLKQLSAALGHVGVTV